MRPPLSGTIVAIVDDDASVREATCNLLRMNGYSAFTFASAEEFLNSPEREIAACLITDVRMQNMSGIAMRDQLLLNGRDIPTIFVTAFADPYVAAKVQQRGAIGLLQKPFDGHVLLRIMGQALDAKNLLSP